MAQVKERGGSRFISRAAKTENPVPRSFFAPKPNGNACYAGYHLNVLMMMMMMIIIIIIKRCTAGFKTI